MEIPKKYTDLVGTEVTMRGHLFSYKKDLPETTFNVLGCRWGRSRVVDINNLDAYEYPTVEFLVTNNTMTKSRWTRGFPVREINLKEVENG